MEELFKVAPLQAGDAVAGEDGALVETLRYRVRPRPSSKFKTLLDPARLFGDGGATSTVITRLDRAQPTACELDICHTLAGTAMRETLTCNVEHGRLRAVELSRTIDAAGSVARSEKVRFDNGPMELPAATYPEVMLPFVMRGQPLDGRRRAAYSWTNDRFVARVYYERRKRVTIDVPAGRFEAALVWMYPDLNDWIALGNVVTRLVKPLLPRYDIWFEVAPPHRVLRFEGPYGPPGAPEIVLELAG